MDALNEAIEYYGGQTAMADALGVTSMAISQWKKRGIPPERAKQIEEDTECHVMRHQLLPDLFDAPSLPKDAAA